MRCARILRYVLLAVCPKMGQENPRVVVDFGNSPEFWLNLQAAYGAAERHAAARIEREVSPREAA